MTRTASPIAAREAPQPRRGLVAVEPVESTDAAGSIFAARHALGEARLAFGLGVGPRPRVLVDVLGPEPLESLLEQSAIGGVVAAGARSR